MTDSFIMDVDVDSDEESELQDLEQLNAALGNSESESTNSTQFETPSTSTCNLFSNYGEYSKIEAALALNKMLDEKLRKLEVILQGRLVECRRRLSEVQNVTDQVDRDEKSESFRYVYCGKPYFKDKRGFPAPDNDDTILMAKSQMYNFSGISSVPGWTVKDKCQLTMVIHKLSKEIKKKELNKQIAELQRKKILDIKENQRKIVALKKEVIKVNTTPLKVLALPIDEEYDWDYIANKLSHRHNAQEYRSLWKLFLHPCINKSVWSRAEHMALQKLAFEKKLQDWDAIAQELSTGRTNYQCFVYFRTNMNNTFTGRKWTKEEEEYLKRLIEYYREDNYIPWGKVAASMENRTKVQIYNKYARLCELRKGKFLPEEDSVILTCVDNFGPNFKMVSDYLQGRSVTQCRDRYQVLAKRRFSAVWTVDEDRKLVQLLANQDASTNFSTVSQYFPGKDRVHIRSRYLTLDKWMRRNPNTDISAAPRRGARRLGHGSKSSENLSRAIESLKKRLQTEVTDKKNKKITKDSPEEVIEDAIVAILATENMKIMEAQKLQSCNEELESKVRGVYSQNVNITSLQKILILLKAKLNKQKFSQSPLREKYQGLLSTDKQQTVQVKSYSKKEAVKNITIDKKLDVWGNVLSGPLSHVLPPQYPTITGCRKLMSHYIAPKSDSEELRNINLLIKRNPLLREQVKILMERFNTLFLWPMLLSNASPDDCKMMHTKKTVSHEMVKKFVAFEKKDYNFAMPMPKAGSSIQSVTDVIDLTESNQNHKITILEDFLIEPKNPFKE